MVSHKKTKKKRILMMRIKKLALKESEKSYDDLYLNDNIEVYIAHI